MEREQIFREDAQEYVQETNMLRHEKWKPCVLISTKHLGHIPCKMRKKGWASQGDSIFAGLKDYQDARADVILKYMPDEARNLRLYGEFPKTV